MAGNAEHRGPPTESLASEELFVLKQIIGRGKVVDIDGGKFLMAPVTPITADLISAIRQGLKDADAGITEEEVASRHPVCPSSHEDLGITLQQLFTQFVDDKGHNWASYTRGNYRSTFRIFYEVLGRDRRIKTIDRSDCVRVRNLLLRQPKHRSIVFRDASLEEAAKLGAEKGMDCICVQTVNKHIIHFNAVFKWAVNQWLLDRNPAEGLRVSRDYAKPHFRRHSFSLDQLKVIFSAPLYTGCKSEYWWYNVKGDGKPRNGRFWVPLIALFAGMRLNEICQLDVADIEKMSGVDCFVISDVSGEAVFDKKVKTPSSRRIVPIHPELKKIGITGYVAKMRGAGETKLFPDLPFGYTGYYSTPFSSWFNSSFLRCLGVHTSKTTFHSFRHNFRDGLREAEVPTDIVRALGGWSQAMGGFDGIYGDGVSPPKLYDELTKLRYPGLDLSHLYESP